MGIAEQAGLRPYMGGVGTAVNPDRNPAGDAMAELRHRVTALEAKVAMLEAALRVTARRNVTPVTSDVTERNAVTSRNAERQRRYRERKKAGA